MLTSSQLLNRSFSMFAEFDWRPERLYALTVSEKTSRTVKLHKDVITAARRRGVPLSDYITQLHLNQRSALVAYVTSIYRGFALLEMARVPVDPAYFELVDGCLGEETGAVFRAKATSGEDHALVKAAAALLGKDDRATVIQAVLMASQRAQVLHEGFIEAARLLESTFYR
jgi:hypothetical protein